MDGGREGGREGWLGGGGMDGGMDKGWIDSLMDRGSGERMNGTTVDGWTHLELDAH